MVQTEAKHVASILDFLKVQTFQENNVYKQVRKEML